MPGNEIYGKQNENIVIQYTTLYRIRIRYLIYDANFFLRNHASNHIGMLDNFWIKVMFIFQQISRKDTTEIE